MENDEMTNDAAVAWLVTNGGKSCEPWLVWELSEVKALPSSCIADPLYSATTVAELRAEIAELTESLEQAQHDYALLANESIYDGNSIGWIASKARNYGDALLQAWDAVREVGGTCDGNTPLHDAIRTQLTLRQEKPE